jgi:hypothetical protein
VTPVLVLAVLVGFLLALGLWRTADRLDRLRHRIEVARATLAAQLLRRSGVALELAAGDVLDPASRLLLIDAAHRARNAGPDDVEAVESALSEALRAVLADPGHVRSLRADPGPGPLVEELARTCARVELARRFHNDAVVAARTLRARRRVRWLHLAGRAGPLATVDLDDAPPAALAA